MYYKDYYMAILTYKPFKPETRNIKHILTGTQKPSFSYILTHFKGNQKAS